MLKGKQMEWKEVYELMDRFEASGNTELELQMGGDSLKLKKAAAGQINGCCKGAAARQDSGQGTGQEGGQETGQPAGTSAASADRSVIQSPMVGIFYTAAGPDEPPFVTVGSEVHKDDVICLIEAMKMMSEVTARQDGVIQEILVQNGDAVEYGQPLFRIQE